MKIGEFQLPPSLVSALAKGTFRRQAGSWRLVTRTDGFGFSLETELGLVFPGRQEIEAATARLPTGFIEVSGKADEADCDLPGGIAYIRDFTGIVCFAIAGDGSPFCLDYRANPQTPSVIWWDDDYWRVLAPTFDSFVALFGFEAQHTNA